MTSTERDFDGRVAIVTGAARGLGRAAAVRLYEQLATYHLRVQGRWSARSKAIPRALRAASPDLCERYTRAFARLFELGDSHDVIHLAETILEPHGGLLFEGFRSDAPAAWRKPPRHGADSART